MMLGAQQIGGATPSQKVCGGPKARSTKAPGAPSARGWRGHRAGRPWRPRGGKNIWTWLGQTLGALQKAPPQFEVARAAGLPGGVVLMLGKRHRQQGCRDSGQVIFYPRNQGAVVDSSWSSCYLGGFVKAGRWATADGQRLRYFVRCAQQAEMEQATLRNPVSDGAEQASVIFAAIYPLSGHEAGTGRGAYPRRARPAGMLRVRHKSSVISSRVSRQWASKACNWATKVCTQQICARAVPGRASRAGACKRACIFLGFCGFRVRVPLMAQPASPLRHAQGAAVTGSRPLAHEGQAVGRLRSSQRGKTTG